MATTEGQVYKRQGFQNSPCVCGCFEYREVLEFASPYVMIECQGCGLRRTFPPIVGLTTGRSQGTADRDWKDLDRPRQKLAQIELRLIGKFVSSGSILDIGCAAGRLPKLAAENGFCAVGLDRESSWLPHSHELARVYSVAGDAHTLPFEAQIFDAINLNHVLEHLENPMVCLREAHRVLKGAGFLFVSVPNHEGLIPHLTRKWAGYAPSIHRWHFSPRSLQRLLRQAGFRIVRFYLDSMPTPKIASALKRTFYRLLNVVQRHIGMGDNIIVVAQHVPQGSCSGQMTP